MNIKTIEEAKKYLGKVVYTAHNHNAKSSRAKNKVVSLYIGGIHLFYNQVNYEVIGFELYENEKCTENWGNVDLERICNTFDKKDGWNHYFFSKVEAEKYCDWSNKDDIEKQKERDIETAKELLEQHKIKFEIFE